MGKRIDAVSEWATLKWLRGQVFASETEDTFQKTRDVKHKRKCMHLYEDGLDLNQNHGELALRPPTGRPSSCQESKLAKSTGSLLRSKRGKVSDESRKGV